LLGFYNKGNLVSAIVAIKAAADLGTLATTLPAVVGSYAITYGIITVASVGLAIARLRRVALAQTYGKAIKARGGMRIWNRPPVGPFPMFWKEINCEGGSRSPWLAWVIIIILLVLTFIWPVMAVIRRCLDFYQEVRPWNNLATEMNIWVCFCNVIVGYLTLFAIGVRASTSITTEREKQTFDTLLTTPMDSGSILSAKWIGSLLGVRFGILWLLMIWAIGIVTGGLHLVSLLFAVVAWTIYAAFAATLGLWFSVTSKSSLRATVWTIAMLIITGAGHWLIWACCGPMLAFSYSPGTEKVAQYLLKAQAGILTPGFVMVWSVLASEDTIRSGDPWNREWWEMTIFSLVGLVGWSIASAVLYSVTSARFRKLTHREEFMSADNSTEERRRQRELRSATPVSPWVPPMGALPSDETEDEMDDEPEEFRYRP
ncbi:MAG TPA: ABC transporter permease subunit, partial [Gemmataceae bacterium]|nr:ABC transporter permease subunit [Gemmataceae bacterium]